MFMTPSLPEILGLATRMAQLDSHPTCDASAKSRAPGPVISSSLDIARPHFVTRNATIDPPKRALAGPGSCGKTLPDRHSEEPSAMAERRISCVHENAQGEILLPQGGIRMTAKDSERQQGNVLRWPPRYLDGKWANLRNGPQSQIPRNGVRGNSSPVVALCLATNPQGQSEVLAEWRTRTLSDWWQALRAAPRIASV